jgi:hypothetical protein
MTRSNVGIAFSFSNALTIFPTTTTYGRYFLVQIINQGDIKKNMLNGTNLLGLEKILHGLDTGYPYQAVNDLWHLGGYSYRTNDMWFDAPGSLVDGSTWLFRTNYFIMYLMFQPALPSYANTIPVPMCSATWSWSATSETNGTSSYYLLSSSPAVPIVSQTSAFPLWNTNSADFQYQTNNTPFDEN